MKLYDKRPKELNEYTLKFNICVFELFWGNRAFYFLFSLTPPQLPPLVNPRPELHLWVLVEGSISKYDSISKFYSLNSYGTNGMSYFFFSVVYASNNSGWDSPTLVFIQLFSISSMWQGMDKGRNTGQVYLLLLPWCISPLAETDGLTLGRSVRCAKKLMTIGNKWRNCW